KLDYYDGATIWFDASYGNYSDTSARYGNIDGYYNGSRKPYNDDRAAIRDYTSNRACSTPATELVLTPPPDVVTSTSIDPNVTDLTTTTVPREGSTPATELILTPPPEPSTVTSFSTGLTGVTTTTVPRSGTTPATEIVYTPPNFDTTTSFVNTPNITNGVTTIPPSGTVPGTVITKVFVGYVTTTNYGTALEPSTVSSTVSPSGSQSGTVIVSVDPGYITSTSCLPGSQPGSTTTTIPPTGPAQGTVLISRTPGYTTLTTQYTVTSTAQTDVLTSTSATPTGCQSGTVVESIPIPFQTADCSINGYLIQRNELYSVDFTSGATNQIATLDTGGDNVNAIGFNIQDNLLYGVQAGATPRVVSFNAQGQISGVLNIPDIGYRIVGDVDENGSLWLADSQGGTWSQINLSPGSVGVVAQGSFTPPYTFFDWAYVPNTGNYLWTVGRQNAENYLMRFDRSSHTIEVVGDFGGTLPENGIWGAMYADNERQMYMSNNANGQIWQIDIGNTVGPNSARLLSTGPAAGSNDGARCAIAGSVVSVPG
ncbi:hypothetical protein KC343_g10827, partial [Hortaea werneckii]